jgi:hypothetical protein
MPAETVELFSKDEHLAIAEWLDVSPIVEGNDVPGVSSALETLGFEGRASGFTEIDAAVAAIILERIQDELPQWASFRTSEKDDSIVSNTWGRDIKARRALHRVKFVPRYLMIINRVDSGLGFSWPVDYHVTWVPIYDTYVVTQSSDSPDAFGFCDFAIGQYPATRDFVHRVARVIRENWEWQRDEFDQHRWAYLFGTGLIGEDLAIQIREQVSDDEPAWS